MLGLLGFKSLALLIIGRGLRLLSTRMWGFVWG